MAQFSAVALGISLLAVVPQAVALAEPAAAQEKISERPDRVSAMLTARLQKSRVEITGERTETSTTWANPDGALTTEVFSGAVRARDAKGDLVPLDLNLVERDGVLRPKAGPADIGISATGGSEPFATVTKESKSFAVSWPTALGKPKVAGNTATYADAVPGGDLVVQALKSGLRYDLVLRTRPTGPLKVRLRLTTKGLAVGKAKHGGLTTVDGGDKKIGSGPTPRMWDATAGERPLTAAMQGRQTTVATSVETTKDGQTLVLEPNAKFLADPATKYPVTVDPTINLNPVADAAVYALAPTTNYSSAPTMDVGSWTDQPWRAFLQFDTSAVTGKKILSSKLTMPNVYAKQCADTGASVQVRRVTSAWSASTVTWSTQPSTTDTGSAASSDAHGFNSSCPAGAMAFDATAITQAWADGQTNFGLALQAVPETDPTGFRSFTSSENTTPPSMQVTYNTAPATPTNIGLTPYKTWNGTSYSGTNPQLFGTATDAEGGYVRHDFEAVKADGTALWSGSSPFVASGQQGSVTIPTGLLSNDMLWKWRTRSFDGGVYSAWSAYSNQRVDGLVPNAPTVWCGYEYGKWNVRKSGDVGCTADTTADDGEGYTWSIDDQDLDNSVTNTGGGAASNFTIKPTDGWHAVYAQAHDGLGNLSGITTYHFGVGLGGLISPTDQDRTQQFTSLASSAQPSRNGVTYQYRTNLTDDAAWTNVPAGHVTLPGTGQPGQGTALGSWPQIRTDVNKDFPELDWDVTRSIADGPVQVRACYSASTGGFDCTSANTLVVERASFSAADATTEFGPGTLALHTGDYAISATDVALDGMSVDRSHTTMAPSTETGPVGVFGPGWRAGFPDSQGVAGYTIGDRSANGYVTLTGTDGETRNYVKQANGTYAGIGDDADTGSFVQDSATKFTFTDPEGVKTIFTKADGVWGPDYTDAPGSENTITYTRDNLGRVTRIIGQVPEGVTCTASSLKPGCTSLRIVYSADTTATGVGSGWGRYTGTVQRVDFTAYDPAGGAMKTTTVAEYTYDSTGHLRQAWDPRITPNLAATYYYNADGRISQLMPPGQASWTFAYNNGKRLTSVSRTDSAGRLAKQSVVYDVSVSPATGGPVDLTAATAATWGQTSGLPLEGTAIFPATHALSADGTGNSVVTSDDWKYARISYQDVNGRTVNSSVFGAGAWQTGTTRYDNNGRVTWSLNAENRAQALTPTNQTDPYVAGRNTSAERADLLATVTTYNTSGDVLTETGPAHRIQLDSGRNLSGRSVTESIYDEGKPEANTAYHLATTVKVSPLVVDGTEAPTSADTRTTKYGYEALAAGDPSGWSLRSPTSVTRVMAGGGDLVTRTRYDHAGRTTETRQPASDGTDAGTKTTVYYTADTNPEDAACGLKPAWAGLLCKTAPKAQPAGKTLPVTTASYDYYGQTAKSTQVNGGTTRTTTMSYDAAGRLTSASLAVVPAANGGQALPPVVVTYNQATGLAETTTAGGKTTTTQHDSFGRVTSYTDGTGNTATTTYTVEGQVETFNDGKGTYTYTYDGNDRWNREEHRGLVTQVDTGLADGAGVIRSGYNGDGQLAGQWYPHAQIWTDHRYNSTGGQTQLGYGGGDGTTWLWDTQGETVHGQTAWTGNDAGTKDYLYDNAGRLTKVWDRHQGQCDVRTYGFNLNTSRTSTSSFGPAADGKCSTSTTPTTVNSAYDTADRITDTGYTYDDLGRTVTVPADQVTGGSPVSVGYYANDMVASLSQNGQSRTYGLDAIGRVSQITQSTGTLTNHYVDGSGDSPAWIAEADGGWTRNIAGQGLSAVQSSNGTTKLQLANLHGDIVATVVNSGPATGIDAYFDYTEYGTARTGDTNRYGWLGAHQRSTETLGGLTLMGVRLYNARTGRFLSADPVSGGSANSYEYASGDPVNNVDLDGRYSCRNKKDRNRTYRLSKTGKFMGTNLATAWIQLSWCYNGNKVTEFQADKNYYCHGAVNWFHGCEKKGADQAGFPRYFTKGGRANGGIHYHVEFTFGFTHYGLVSVTSFLSMNIWGHYDGSYDWKWNLRNKGTGVGFW